MTAISKSPNPDQFSKTRCHICNYPAGTLWNKITGEKIARYFRKAMRGKYICNICVV